MSQAKFIQGPEAVETADLHFKALSKLRIFNSYNRSIDGKTNLIAVSQYYGLVFIGTSCGFIIMKSKEIFSATDPETYYHKVIVTDSVTSHLAVDFEQKHLAVGCESSQGAALHVYSIPDFVTKGETPMKTFPFSYRFDGKPKLINELKWQPNASSCLTVCFTDGSLVCFHVFKEVGNKVFSVPVNVQARCMCWSPKGKQLVIGSSDGTLSQYTPELKFIKQLVAPPLFNGSVSVVNVLWISSFQFLAAYTDENKPKEFPVIIIVNAPKNEPVKFINYDDITFSSTFFRAHQLYFYHQPAWNVILVASSNSIEVAVLHAKKDSSIWEQWLLGDASRAELPLNFDKLETFPLGIAVDYTSDQIIPWGEETLPPAPRLLLLSSEGFLITFNFINTTQNTPPLCSLPKENFDDAWFTIRSKTLDQVGLNKMGQGGVDASVIEKPGQMSPPVSTFWPMPFSNQESLLTSPALANFKTQPVKTQQTIFPMQSVTPNQQTQQLQLQEPFQTIVQASSDANSLKGPQKPSISYSFSTLGTNQSVVKKDNEYFEVGEKQNLDLVGSTYAVTGREPAKPEDGKGNLVDKSSLNETDAKTTEDKAPETSPSRSTPEIAPIDESVYVTALLDEIDHFNSELKHVISRISSLKIHIGSDGEKENLRESLEKLKDINKGLSEITNNQESKIYSLKCDIIEAFAWLEDARSRNRQRKNRAFIELKKSEDLDPMSSRIMKEISNMKYYIENQLKQLNLYLMKEWMHHQDSCRLYIKTMMTVPSTEELYKTMYLELNILNKQRLIVEELKQRVKEKTIKARSQTALISNSMDYLSKPSENKGSSELYKLADNLLQLEINSDEQNDRINVTDAFQMMVKNQIMEIVERSKKFTSAKQNILRDTLFEREMMKTRSVKSTLASSSFIRNTSSRICSKYFTEAKKSEIDNKEKTINAPLGLAPANESPGFLLANSARREGSVVKDSNSDILSAAVSVEKEAPHPAEANAFISGNQLNSETPIVFGLSTLTAKADVENSNLGVFTFSGPKASGAALFSDSDKKNAVEKSVPFVFKAPPNLSSVLNSSGKPKSLSPALIFSSGSSLPVGMTPGDSTASNFTFKKTDVNFTPPSGSAFSLTPVKNSSAFSPKTSTPFSGSFAEGANNKSDVSTATSEVKTIGAVATSSPSSIFLFPSGGNAAPVPSTAAATLSGSTLKFTIPESASLFPSAPSTPQNITENSVKSFPSPSLSTPFASSAGPESVANAGAVAGAALKPTLTTYFKAFTDPNPTLEKTVELGASNQEVTAATKTSTTPTTCATVTWTTITPAAPVVAATETTENNLGTATGAIVASVQEITKAESVAKKPEGKGSDEKSVGEESEVTVVETPKEDAAGAEKSESNDGVAPAFPQQPVFGGVGAANTSFVTTATTGAISFGASGKSIFGQAPPATSTTSNIFSTVNSSIFSSEKPVTARSGLFSSGTETSGSSIFGDAITTAPVTTSASLFGQVTATTSSATPPVQQSAGKDEIGQATQLFGDILKTGMTSDSIFGKSNFEKSGTSIFGNAAPSGTTASTTSIFGTTSSNIFSKSSFGQMSSGSSNVFGQPQSESNTFFGQNICGSFGGTTTTPQAQNPFASATGFNSSPIFSQGLFDQSSNQQNPFGRSTTSIFGNSTTSSSSGVNIFQMGSGSFSNSTAEPFNSGQSTTGRSPLFQKLLTGGGFGGAPVFGGGLATDGFGAPPTFGGAATFGSPPSFGSPQKVFGSSQSTFGQNQTHTPNFQSLADQSSDGFSNLAQQNQNQAFGGNTFNQNAAFGSETTYGGESFSNWR